MYEVATKKKKNSELTPGKHQMLKLNKVNVSNIYSFTQQRKWVEILILKLNKIEWNLLIYFLI